MEWIEEEVFMQALLGSLDSFPHLDKVGYVTGPGRSGAVASVYASHHTGLPFVPYKCKIPDRMPLIVDTVWASGGTITKAMNHYQTPYYVVAFMGHGCRVKFWYERLSYYRDNTPLSTFY